VLQQDYNSVSVIFQEIQNLWGGYQGYFEDCVYSYLIGKGCMSGSEDCQHAIYKLQSRNQKLVITLDSGRKEGILI
jgi:hypothetical protein